MIVDRKALILSELLDGTGAAFSASARQNGLRQSLRIWFADLDEIHGPLIELHPFGLRGHRVRLSFGNFAGLVISQMKSASAEDMQLARALVSSIRPSIIVEVPGQTLEDWEIKDGSFQINAIIRDLENANSDSALVSTCREVIVPLMAAMAELIGYDVIDNSGALPNEPDFEGAILRSTVRRRERNPRNRLLCIRIHGEKCAVCGLEPKLRYGKAGAVIEVHHLQPLANLEKPRPYDPKTDLIPLCPTCHRAAHTSRPVPYTPDQLKGFMEALDG
jgi:5-methylcytosine-specific restriction protein A